MKLYRIVTILIVTGLTLLQTSTSAAATLFPTDLPTSKCVELDAAGFDKPVTGVIYDYFTPATNGMPLGAIDVGCIDLETSGLWGYCTIFNTHVPRRGPMNLPFLGISVGGQTWVLCDPSQTKDGEGNFQPPTYKRFAHHVPYLEKQCLPVGEPYLNELELDG